MMTNQSPIIQEKLISLGGNCAVTYQLMTRNQRTEAYPFDWTALSLKKLLSILKNNFEKYCQLELLKYSSCHPLFISEARGKSISPPIPMEQGIVPSDLPSSKITSEGSYVVTNQYRVKFAHELQTTDLKDNFQIALQRRVIRFQSLTGSLVFIRYEFARVKNYLPLLLELKQQLDRYFPCQRYRLIIILHESIHIDTNMIDRSKIMIYRFQTFSADWQAPEIDWDQVFE